MNPPSLPVGQRIRHYRHRNGNRSQAAIAGLCGISERYLQQIEAGQKMPSAAVLARLADELHVPITALMSDKPIEVSVPPATAAPQVIDALTARRSAVEAVPTSPEQLTRRVELAWRIWQSSRRRFTQAADLLPDLIADVEHARRSAGSAPQARREVLRAASDLYGLLRSYCRRAGRLDLALMVADRALRAAEEADDPVRLAAAHWNFAHVLLSRADPDSVEQAKDIALSAVDQVRRTPPVLGTKAVEGALQLVAAVSDARRGRHWEARERLEQQARPIARQVGEGNVQWTVFGPTNVDMHAVSIEMLAGEAAEGLRLADQIDPDRALSRERRFTFTLEIARCHELRRDDAAVLVHLFGLQELAPEDLARSPFARDMVAGLQKRVRPTFRRQVTELAEQLRIV